ncbi:DUF916 domain-containing protein [Agromyces mediolanus]|uniref:DUF916 domain-containing protein n=1 Tax=Agromyces mediolanus TaxID=41986 RepID=A0A918F6S8_AGRME|nr:DUF916 domain-containing protein [Agromyces mediolanus]GGR13756.1 hypothetical protein GCM10010196_02890 [Agromyces mediolanus]GLJ72693.1 hypothetical protein GCM10017583_19490 [Agromyces mediolanus]
MPRRLPLALGALLLAAPLALAGALSAPLPAVAEGAGGEAPVTWSVAPATEQGADGRAWVELELDPGATVTEHLAVRNLGDAPVVFALGAADGYFTPSGRFNMLASDAESVDAGTWIALPETVEVAAGGTAVVPFTVTVPERATPGDHAAGVAASITSVAEGDGATLGVESRVGFRVMTRVSGELEPGLAVAAGGGYRLSWNPFAPGAIELSAELENTGNVRLALDPSAEAGGARRTADGVAEGQRVELLPGERRTVRFTMPAVWPTVLAGAVLRVEGGAIDPSGEAAGIDPVVREVTIWALPVPQLAVLAGAALLALGILLGRRRSRARLERLLEDAHHAGRREALAEEGPQ